MASRRTNGANLPSDNSSPHVRVREYKGVDLHDATLVVSVPHTGIGSSLVTDYILEQFSMDQVACLDSPWFPPLAIVRGGRARFPARIHADAKRKVAVLRCEFQVAPFLARPTAAAILDWAAERGLGRIVMLDGIQGVPADGAHPVLPKLFFLATTDDTRARALRSGLVQLPEGALGGVPAMLLLEGRFRQADCVGLFAEVTDGLDEARSSLAFAKALPTVVPGFHLDPKGLEAGLVELDQEIRRVRDEAMTALAQMERGESAPQPMYG